MHDSNSLFQDKFLSEDYDQLNEKYFKQIRLNNEKVIDPSGWRDTFTPVKSFLMFGESDIHKYNTDLGNQLMNEKNEILPLLNRWDQYQYSNETFTLCHSATVASVILLSMLSKLGIKTIFFETPCYYATIYQARDFGIKTVLVPTYYTENFSLNIDKGLVKGMGPFAIWITQPRTSLGFNQDNEGIRKILKMLGSKGYLIVDEATEQCFPSHLSNFNVSDYRIIKIRSFFKGLGLNGIRLSYIAHSEKLRDIITQEMEIYQGALDLYSINYIKENAKNVNRFKLMLDTSRSQISKTNNDLKKIIIGNEYISASEIVNGYIGCLFLHYDKLKQPEQVIRKKLLEFSSKSNMPLILGSSMWFAIHNRMEFIRLNYYNKFTHMKESVQKLNLFFSALR